MKESPVDIVARWKRESAEIKERLRARRQELAAELALVDQALADLEPKQERKVRETAAAVSPNAPSAEAAPPATARQPGKRGPNGALPALLMELRAFWDVALSPRQREIVGLRASGKMPEEISKQLGADYNTVKNILFRSKALLVAARERSDKPAAEKPASDSEEDPEPAPGIDWALLGADSQGYVGPEPATDFPPISPGLTQAHEQEPESAEEEAETSSQNVPHGRTGVGRGRGPRHCRRCGQPGHQIDTCTLDDSDLAAARVQDIAAACVRLGLAPAPPPRAPLPVRALPPPVVEPGRVIWDREDPEQDLTDLDLPAPPAQEAATAPLPPPAPVVEEGEPVAPSEAVARVRTRLHVVGDGRVRGKTIAPRALSREERRDAEELSDPGEIERPRVRGDCEDDPGRPCPWVSCSHHLYLDVNPDTGAIKLNFPHLEVWQLPETCSLDVANRGGITLEEVGVMVNLTRERVRQVETRGMEKIRDADEGLDQAPERFASPLGAAMG